MSGTRVVAVAFLWLAASVWTDTPAAAPASSPGPIARITERIDETRRVELTGHVHPAVAGSQDLGAADPTAAADRMIMVLRASAAQETELAQFLRDVQTRGRPEYHHWLTPRAFGERFGAAAADIAAVRSWLQSKGFRLEPAAASGRSIVFSGTIGEVNEAFAARMHRYRWRGETHLANAANPTIPQALAPVVRGFASLHDFRLQPQYRRSGLRFQTNLVGGAHALAPGDFAIIYDLTSTYASGLTGAGTSIAVIGRSDVQNTDISNFRSMFGLSAALPTVIRAGSDPGYVSGDQTESDLDLEWSGGVAPAAALKFVTAQSTNTTDGVILSALYAVEQNVADVITVSYAGCESPGDVSGGTTLFNQLWQQAAAQGTSVFISSGDSGAAGCDPSGSAFAMNGLGVNALCTSPYSTCVGGTEFTADISSPGTYWSSKNTSGTYASALQYIGEAVWNQSGTVSGGADLWSSGGGASIYFAKPAWQLTTGVPSDGQRDVPDVSLAASGAHDPYLIYTSDNSTNTSTLAGVGGTSAAAPTMAAIAALITQSQHGRIGSLNPVLYGLAQLQSNGGAAVFHLITSGNNSVPNQTGFSASTTDAQYNQATGLGSVDAGVLIAHWGDFNGTINGLSPTTAAVPATVTVGSATLVLPSTTTWTATVSGGGADWLSVTPTSGTGSVPLTYSVTANTTSASRTGTVTIDGQVLTVTQAAQSGAASQLRLSNSSLSFGSDGVGSLTAGQSLLVSNTGGTNLQLGAISITGPGAADYHDSGSCATGLVLVPGASCFLQVTFDPTQIGTRSATLQIGTTSIALSGTGVASEDAGSDGPLPLWAYVLMGGLILLVAQARAADHGRRT